MKVIAAVLVQLGQPLEFMELELPPLKGGQVLVKMAYSGLCHSQLNEIAGLKGDDPYLPHTLGHEGSGIVLDVGREVKKVKPGDAVVATWIKGMGREVSSSSYESSAGKINSGAISTFLTHAVISENRLVPIPQSMPLREAALLGCALPTGAGVVEHEMKIKKNQSIALFGMGGIGLSALLAAKMAGASPIIVIDIQERKLQKALSLGATHSVLASQSDPVASILEITQRKGVDYSFEAAGKSRAMEDAFKCLKAPGGLCVLAGNLPKGEKMMIDPFELIRGKRIIGTWGGNSIPDADIKRYVSLYAGNHLPLAALITHEVPLVKINELICEMERGNVGRGLISFSNVS